MNDTDLEVSALTLTCLWSPHMISAQPALLPAPLVTHALTLGVLLHTDAGTLLVTPPCQPIRD